MGLIARHNTKRTVAKRCFASNLDPVSVAGALHDVLAAETARVAEIERACLAGELGRMRKSAAERLQRRGIALERWHIAELESDRSWLVSFPDTADKAIQVSPGRHSVLVSAFLPAKGWIAQVDCTPDRGGSSVSIEVKCWVTRDGGLANRDEYERFVSAFCAAAVLTSMNSV